MSIDAQINFDQLIKLFNAGHIGIAAADQLAKNGYRLELDKAHNVTAIVKDEL